MRMLMQVKMPTAKVNALIKAGKGGETIGRLVEATKPEAAYFTEVDGQRTALLVVDVPDPSNVPSLAEPWFLTLDAEVTFRIAMTAEDLGRAGLDDLGKRWA